MVVLKEVILTVSTLGEDVRILKELICNGFYFGGECCGPKRTTF